MERNGTPTFPDNKDRYGIYTKTHKWCHKNMRLLPPRPKEINTCELDFIDLLEWDWN